MYLRKSFSEHLLDKIRSGEIMSRNEKFNLIIQLSMPSILAQVTTVLMFYIDAGMVGSLGAEPSAAIGLVEPATWLFFTLVNAVTMGFSVQIAHFIGANDFAKARAVMRHGYIFGLCFSLLLLSVTILIAPYLPIWLGGGAYILFDHTCPPHRIHVSSYTKSIRRYATSEFYGNIDVYIGCRFQLFLYFPDTYRLFL